MWIRLRIGGKCIMRFGESSGTFFIDPHFHGLDLTNAERVYAPFLDRVASRDDLNDLFRWMIGNLVVGHLWVGGGTEPHIDEVNVGLLGADYEIAHDRYRFKTIYSGQNWNPSLRAPLTQPGCQRQSW